MGWEAINRQGAARIVVSDHVGGGVDYMLCPQQSSNISSSVRIFIFSFSQFKRPRCVGPLWGILSQCGAAGAPGMGGFP